MVDILLSLYTRKLMCVCSRANGRPKKFPSARSASCCGRIGGDRIKGHTGLAACASRSCPHLKMSRITSFATQCMCTPWCANSVLPAAQSRCDGRGVWCRWYISAFSATLDMMCITSGSSSQSSNHGTCNSLSWAWHNHSGGNSALTWSRLTQNMTGGGLTCF